MTTPNTEPTHTDQGDASPSQTGQDRAADLAWIREYADCTAMTDDQALAFADEVADELRYAGEERAAQGDGLAYLYTHPEATLPPLQDTDEDADTAGY